MRDGGVVRPHWVKLQPYSRSPLDPERREESHEYMRQMFTHILNFESEVKEVLGNSWLYNLAAYRDLYPPAYTEHRPPTQSAEFCYLALWGQCFDRYWQPRAREVDSLLSGARQLHRIEDVIDCFPLKVLTPRCPIEVFDRYYA